MEKTQENPEREILSLGDEKFYVDSLTEKGQQLVADVRVVDNELKRAELTLGIIAEAKNSLFNKLVDESVNFEKVPETEEDSK